MKPINKLVVGLFLSLCLSVLFSLGSEVQAKHHGKHHSKSHDGKGKGPCAEIECEHGDKFCYGKKKECMSKMFQKKLDEAKSKGLSAEKKAKWTKRMEEKIAHKKERIKDMQAHIAEMEANLKQVKALKTK